MSDINHKALDEDLPAILARCESQDTVFDEDILSSMGPAEFNVHARTDLPRLLTHYKAKCRKYDELVSEISSFRDDLKNASDAWDETALTVFGLHAHVLTKILGDEPGEKESEDEHPSE